MNKYEYIYLLQQNLQNYDGDIAEIIANYDNIINEMLDEGLSMDDIVRRLGSPAVLAEEIAEELGLKFSSEYQQRTKLPTWSKVLLIVCAVILFFPLLGVFLGIIGTIIGFIFGIIGTLIGGLFGAFAIWVVPTLPVYLKLVITIAVLSACLSIAIILYFMTYGLYRFVAWAYEKLRELWARERGRL